VPVKKSLVYGLAELKWREFYCHCVTKPPVISLGTALEERDSTNF
jgi:deoxyribodipyrimidine photolyase